MSFLKKFLGSEKNKNNFYNPDKKTINNLFKIDLTNLPDNTFYLTKVTKNDDGKYTYYFKRNLEYLECNLFDKIEVILHSETNYNLVFDGEFSIDNSHLECFINNLISIYGKDDEMKGGLISSEITDIKNDFWVGRNYFNEKRYPNLPPCNLSGDEGRIQFVIFNPKNPNSDYIEPDSIYNYKPEGIPLLEKLKELNIDIDKYYQEENSLELSVEDELNRINHKYYITLNDNFFTSCIIYIYEDKNRDIFFIKNKTSEKDYKSFIDTTSEILGLDISGRSKFSWDDLNRIRGIVNDDDDELRHWIDIHNEYDIDISFDEEDKNLFLRIYKSQFN